MNLRQINPATVKRPLLFFCCRAWVAAVLLLPFLFPAHCACGKEDQADVLMVTGIPWLDQSSLSGFMGEVVYALDRKYSLKQHLEGVVSVDEIFWNYCGRNQLEGAEKRLANYRVLVFWDVPPSAVPPAFADAVKVFVKKGGIFIMHGGLTCFSGYAKPLGGIASNFPWPDYGSYRDSPLAEILPVEMLSPEEIQKGHQEKIFKECNVSQAPGSLAGNTLMLGKTVTCAGSDTWLRSIPWEKRPAYVYHKVKPRANATVLLTSDNGDPLLVMQTVGKGKVIANMFSERGALWFNTPLMWQHDRGYWAALMRSLLGSGVKELSPAKVRLPLAGETAPGVKVKLLRQAYERGENVEGEVSVADADALEIRLLDAAANTVFNQAIPQYRAGNTQTVAIPTYCFRPGDYRLEIVSTTKGAAGGKSMRPIYIRDWIYPVFKYGAWTFLVSSGLNDLLYEFYNDLGFNFNLLYQFNTETCDLACKYGMQNMVHTQYGGGGGMARISTNAATAQIASGNGKEAPTTCAFGYNVCPRNPMCLETSKSMVARTAASRRQYAAFRAGNIEEEWGTEVSNPYTKVVGIPCYCKFCNRVYEEKTGRKAPPPRYQEPGYVAPMDDPWYQWTRIVRRTSFDDYHRRLVEFKNRLVPDFILTALDVGDSPEMDVIFREIYVSNYAKPSIMGSFIVDWCLAIQDGLEPKKPVWNLLGLFRMPESASVSSENVSLQTKIAIGSGSSCIHLWGSYYLSYTWPHARTTRSTADEARELGNMIRQYGPMFLQLKRVRRPVAIVYDYVTLDYQQVAEPEGMTVDMERPWKHAQAHELAYPAVRRAGILAELITDQQILNGRLKDYQAVILANMEYSCTDIVRCLEEFIAGGGKVFKDISSKVSVKGSQEVPVDFLQWHCEIAKGNRPQKQPIDAAPSPNFWSGWDLREKLTASAVEVLRSEVTPKLAALPVKIESDRGMYELMHNGSARYYFIYNTSEEPGEEMAASVTIRDRGHVYDLLAGKSLGRSDETFTVKPKIVSADWKIYVFLDTPIRKVVATVPATVARNAPLPIHILVQDDKGQPVDASVPLEISVFDPQGRVEAYSGFAATDHGEYRVEIPLAMNDPVGKWRIQVRELITSMEATANLVVEP